MSLSSGKSRPPQTRADLEAMTKRQWATWLQDEIGAWMLPTQSRSALRPFHPLAIPLDDLDPGSRLADEIKLSCGGRVSTPAAAAEQLLKSWSVERDGVDSAALLITLCAHLRSSDLIPSIKALLAGVMPLTEPERQVLGLAVVHAASRRLTQAGLVDLGEILRRAGLYSPMVAAELVAARCSGDLNAIERMIAGSPFEHDDGCGPAYAHLVGLLLERRGPADLEQAWEHMASQKIRRRLRQALADLTTYDPIEAPASPLDGSDKRTEVVIDDDLVLPTSLPEPDPSTYSANDNTDGTPPSPDDKTALQSKTGDL